jgi:hypothetical protein
MDRYLTIEQAADALAVSTDTVRRLLPRLGAFDLNRGTKGRRLIRIPEDGLRAYVRQCAIIAPTRTPGQPIRIERRRA